MASAPGQNSPARSSAERILLSAKHLFATRGYENTSTVAIARGAGTSESQLMKHFGSKEGLLEAIFDTGWAALAERVAHVREMPAPDQKLRALLEITLVAMDNDPDLRQLLLLEGRRIRKEGNMVMMTKGFLGFVSLLDEVLKEMRAAGQMRPQVNPVAARSAIMGMFEGMMRDQLLAKRGGFPAQFDSGDLRRIFDSFIAALK
ncbi:MAG TPA: TetR/AcrR family transcriptional regulator [Terriglobales bacterium]|nr:TetR/AcrR family transcriptional regulator [Terriglobales bacterium]